MNWEKCKLFEAEIEFLGHIVNAHGIKPTKAKVEAILNAPVPQSISVLKSYLRLLNFYGKFIPMLSDNLVYLVLGISRII